MAWKNDYVFNNGFFDKNKGRRDMRLLLSLIYGNLKKRKEVYIMEYAAVIAVLLCCVGGLVLVKKNKKDSE